MVPKSGESRSAPKADPSWASSGVVVAPPLGVIDDFSSGVWAEQVFVFVLGRHFENKPGAKEGGQGISASKIDDNTAKMLAEVIHKVIIFIRQLHLLLLLRLSPRC